MPIGGFLSHSLNCESHMEAYVAVTEWSSPGENIRAERRHNLEESGKTE